MDPHHSYTTYTSGHYTSGNTAPASYTAHTTGDLRQSGSYGTTGTVPGLSYSYTQHVTGSQEPLRKSIAAGDVGFTTAPASYTHHTAGLGLSGTYTAPTSYTSTQYTTGPGISQSYAVERTTQDSPLKKSFTITSDMTAPTAQATAATTNYGTTGTTGLSGTYTSAATYGTTTNPTSYTAPSSYTATSHTTPSTYTTTTGTMSNDEVNDVLKKYGLSTLGGSNDPHKVWQQINPTPEVHSHSAGLYTNLPPSTTQAASYTSTTQPSSYTTHTSSYTATQPASYTTATQPASYTTATQSASYTTATQPASYTTAQTTYAVTPSTPEKKLHDSGITVQRGVGVEGAKQSRQFQTLPNPSGPKQSILSPYRHSMYPEFELVEDFPDRSNLIDSINTFLQKSPAKESLLVSPSRVSIKRQSLLSPAEIEVQSLIKEKYEDGAIYEGEGRNGRRHGRGRLTFKDGRTLQGTFRDGRAEGNAVFYYRNGKVCYEGGVDDTLYQGQGVLQSETPIPLAGGFDCNNFGNLGNYWTKYEGEFRGGKKHGQGTLYLTNGEKFTGEFRDDRVEGKGAFHGRDGRVIQGVWENNVLRRTL